MDSKSKERFKRLLLTKQREVMSGQNGIALSSRQDGEPQGDAADQATVETEAKVQARLRQTEGHLMRAIEEALGRIEQGTFGICQVCEKPIPAVRLEAVPWTRVCRECKERKEG